MHFTVNAVGLHTMHLSLSRACARPHLMFAADCKWSYLMDNYAWEKTSAVRHRKKINKNKAQDEARALR